MYYVYVIVNEVNEIYIGYTKDLRNRMKEHNASLAVGVL